MKMLQAQYEEYLREQEQLLNSDFTCSFEGPSPDASPLMPPKEEKKDQPALVKPLELVETKEMKIEYVKEEPPLTQETAATVPDAFEME